MYHASSSTSMRHIENAKVLAFTLNKSRHTRLTHEVHTFHIFYQFQTGAQCATDHDQGVMGFLVVAWIADCIPAAPSTTDQQRGLKKQRAQEHFHHPFDCSNIFANALPPSHLPAYPAPVFYPHRVSPPMQSVHPVFFNCLYLICWLRAPLPLRHNRAQMTLTTCEDSVPPVQAPQRPGLA